MSQKIELKNPSFEDLPRNGVAPSGWYDCGQNEETPPDIQPGWFEVTKKPQHQTSYLGLVTRDNDTWEGVGQRLSTPLRQGQCYEFSLYLARSETYKSLSKTTRVIENFNGEVRIRIWGGSSFCSKKEKLAETPVVAHTDWRKYDLKLNPSAEYSYIYIEAFFKPTLLPYNGNILVDNCSAIIPCDEVKPPTEPLADNKPTTQPKPKPKPKPEPKPEPITTNPPAKPPVKSEPTTPKPKIIPELDRKKITKGQTIEVKNLYFEADTFTLRTASYDVLDEIYDFLKENSDVVIEVGGHTNNIPEAAYCDWLSEQRAKAVVEYLIEKGIESKRLKYKGYGKNVPLATNRTAAGRKRNQRVEIKILSVG